MTTNMIGLAFITTFHAAVAVLARLVDLTSAMIEPAALTAVRAA